MPFTPRRAKGPEPPPPIDLTDEHVMAAMDRAAEIRRRNAVNPSEVSIQPMAAIDAMRATQNYRLRSYAYRLHHHDSTTPDPWWFVGWIGQEPSERDVGLAVSLRLSRSWEVWLNVEDGRVWLKFDRQIARATRDRDDPYP